MLDAGLEKRREGKLVGVGGDVRVLRIRKGARSVVHRAKNIAGERKGCVVGGSPVGQERKVIVPLRTIDCLGADEVRVCTLPASHCRGTVEVDQQMVSCSALEKFDHEIEVLVGIAGEKVNLDALHAQVLTPGELLFAVLGSIEAVFRARSAVDPAY